MIKKLRRHQFLFEELVKRDFKTKYKRTALGMAWSVLSPLLTLMIMRLVFTQFFGGRVEHYRDPRKVCVIDKPRQYEKRQPGQEWK